MQPRHIEGLSRPRDVIGSQLEQRHAARLARPKTARTWRPKHLRLNILCRSVWLVSTGISNPIGLW